MPAALITSVTNQANLATYYAVSDVLSQFQSNGEMPDPMQDAANNLQQFNNALGEVQPGDDGGDGGDGDDGGWGEPGDGGDDGGWGDPGDGGGDEIRHDPSELPAALLAAPSDAVWQALRARASAHNRSGAAVRITCVDRQDNRDSRADRTLEIA